MIETRFGTAGLAALLGGNVAANLGAAALFLLRTLSHIRNQNRGL